ncbi:MAG: EAL domain-containing response regulator [Pseudomonadota bacterium]
MHNRFKSVLVIDDDPTQIAILTAYFAGLGIHRIESANNAAMALSKILNEENTFDLIVSDLQMPEMDGLEFLRHLNAQKFKGDLVIMSGVEHNLLEHAAKLAKMHRLNLIGQIQKPLNKTSLEDVFLRVGTIESAREKSNSLVLTQGDFITGMEDREILPYFQPKVDLRDGRIVGAEALARWKKPGVGYIRPEVFIEFASENGWIEELTIYLLKMTLEASLTFLRVNPNLRFAVNLAPSMMHQIALPDQLKSTIEAYGISAENISFEITENSILNLDASTLEVLSRLRIHNFDVAIDDFGTGSSNIQTLRDFPYSELKIDKSFISNVTKNAFSKETVNAAVALAKEQSMRIVAEGVEDVQTLEYVQSLGIEHAQGYLFAKALPEDDYLSFISEHKDGMKLSELYKAA